MSRAIYWRCFHCGDAFTKAQEKHARDHFGANEGEKPVCLIREPGEYHLLRALRDAQDELNSYRAEDTELWRALHAMSSDHRQALVREEERGYGKGVADARSEAADLLRALIAVHAPYKTLTDESLEAGILMEFGPPKPDRGAAQLLVRSAIAKSERGAAEMRGDAS